MTLPDAIAVLAAMAEQRTRGPLAAPLANDAHLHQVRLEH
jgi:hypothetical protein